MTRLIDADALKKDIEENSIVLGGVQAIEIDCAKALINIAPTIDTTFREVVAYECGQKSVERPKGEWMKSDIPESLLAKCSICGFDCGAYTHNFCPNCGAKMIKETENEN